MGTIFMLYTKLHIFSIQYALFDNIYVIFAWFVKDFRICNIKFQKKKKKKKKKKNQTEILGAGGLTHSKISDYSSFIYFCGFIYLVINFPIM